MIRRAVVAGSFYPGDPKSLSEQLDDLLPSVKSTRDVQAIIVPHAGYIYSGKIAGAVFAQIDIPETVILIGPNHTGIGPSFSLSAADSWQTPLGLVAVAKQLRRQLLEQIPYVKADDSAHSQEHSLEVMLPFLQRLRPDVKILPLTLGSLTVKDALVFGMDLAKLIAAEQQDVLLLASSDMNHFSAASVTEKMDHLALEEMIRYDPQALYQVVSNYGISMCGVLPVVAVMTAARQLGAHHCRLIGYGHSGQINGDNNRVVGYAGLIVE
jgi:AmmeMemoRadiSam system protein B